MNDSREVDVFLDMRETSGWRFLRAYLEQRIEENKNKLLKVDPGDVAGIAKLQAKAEAFKMVINKVNSTKQEG